MAGLAGSEAALRGLALPGTLVAASTAGYTAFLFAQCEGRDLWQTPLLLPALLAQAVVAGAAAVGLADVVMYFPATDAARWALLAGLVVHLGLMAVETVHRRGRQVELAVRVMIRVREAERFWAGVATAVFAVVLAALAIGGAWPMPLTAVASVSALCAITLYEAAFIRAGQSVPLS
jgi:Ni/Fe-hydrogenase subunit HybB-like protein